MYEGHDIQLRKTDVNPKSVGGYVSYTLSIIPQASQVIKNEGRIPDLIEKIPEIVFTPQSEEALEKMASKFYETGLKKYEE